MVETGLQPRRWTKPGSWLLAIVAVSVAGYLLVTAFEAYDPKAPECVTAALVTGVDSIPKTCKFPVFQLVLALIIIGVGLKGADKLSGK